MNKTLNNGLISPLQAKNRFYYLGTFFKDIWVSCLSLHFHKQYEFYYKL